MFSGFGADLPWFTAKVMSLSHWMQTYSLYTLLGLVGIVLFVIQARKRSYSIKLAISRLGLKLPIIGGVIAKASIAKFSRHAINQF